MKQFFILCTIVAAMSACSNKPAEGSGSEGSNSTPTSTEGSNQVTVDQIENPATANNPQAQPENLTEMTFASTEYNFGDILEGQQVETTFEFTNSGKHDLLIHDCTASCGCTVPEWPKTPVKPGEKGKIKVKFDSTGKSGMNNKTVTVKANVPGGNVELKFKANVRAVKKEG